MEQWNHSMYMRIVSITLLRNEEDIVEAFVRYHCQFFDQMILVDHGSTDETLHILQTLKKEGLPLTIRLETRFGHLQSEVMTKLMHELNADWIIPIDADEFLRSDKNIREILSGISCDCVQKILSYVYVPTGEDDQEESNIFKRIQHRRTVESIHSASVLIPRRIAADRGNSIAQGNHSVRQEGEEIQAHFCNELSLAHFPYRTALQTRKKIITGWPRTVASFGQDTILAFHWREIFLDLLQGRKITYKDLEGLALQYPRIGKEDEEQTLVHDPFPFPEEIAKNIHWRETAEEFIATEELMEVLRIAQAHYELDKRSREQARYIDELERRLDGMQKSKSWRWTQWIRNLEAWLFRH